MTSSDVWDEETARQYDDDAADKFAPEVLRPTVDYLARLAGSGRALELVIGDMATTARRQVRDRAVGPGTASTPARSAGRPMSVDQGHLVLDTYDPVSQEVTSHHVWRSGERTARYESGRFRYIWPAECDLMAQLAGMELEQRVAGWDGAPFTSDSESHVSVWRKA